MDELCQLIQTSTNIVFFGGAGVSTESGIPDFRSSTGLYSTSAGEFPPEYMLSHSCFVHQTAEFFDFYRANMLYPQAQPNAAHRALAKLEELGRLRAVITQNIDGLHQLAGSRRVIELHGSVHRNYCVKCGAGYDVDFILTSQQIPLCSHCGGVVKPDVVLYEEALDSDDLDSAADAIRQAEVLIVGGTSLNVYPAAGLLSYYPGHHLVLINKSQTPADRRANLVIHDALGPVLSAAVQGWDDPPLAQP